ncbi:hypothetical protein G3N95_05180 [Paraburkholderia sp. Tr-20389]|uniref:hypothetical protein n=1 Tax=Paraburkholderia sp. Tr-20389 TaxID=2703903 RepID=UPI00197F3A6B|nr:hypothetical protein [Paraburkholderia sp. Tr-20389]MBN3752320.1 hypothetical protein [Paraburkholderia sp. Tr-20389]
MKQAYGAGIYSTDFSIDGKFVVVTTRLGVDVLDVEKKSIASHDPAYTPEFPLQSCDKNQTALAQDCSKIPKATLRC